MTANALILQEADGTLTRFLHRVFEVLHSKCGDCSGGAVHALWQPILDATSVHQPVVPVFTLNYDWTFEKLAIERMAEYQLSDGFELLGGTWVSGRLTQLKPVSGKTNIALCKLHGSTNWLAGGPVKSLGSFPSLTTQDPDFPPHQFDMVYPGHVHEKWFGKESWRPIHGPDVMFGPWIEQEPYSTLYELLGSVLRSAHLLVSVTHVPGSVPICVS
ncbi:MAG TPA: hypothetical protein VHQ65_14480 [Thermoanaerobaculia bacterium]|nr:hypothetical protein [Thermoanaerobaculia bacterium]